MVTEVTSFDRTEVVRAELARPDRYRHLFGALESDLPVIPRGAGLSYCCASAGAGVRAVSALCFNRILDFDSENGSLTVEPGLRVGDLLAFALSRGWQPPVLPGHPMITVGGCIGFNIHGKSQQPSGNFINCVERLVLYHPDYGSIECSRSQEPGLFELTVGGFGLTGFITQVQLRLVRLQSRSVVLRRIPARNLIEAVAVMEREGPQTDTLYSWNDLNRRGDSFGKGVVYAENGSDDVAEKKVRFRRLQPGSKARWQLPAFHFPSAVLFTRCYGRLETLRRRRSRLDLKTSAFPINGKEVYFTLFGHRGFHEYQMLIPRSTWPSAVAQIDARIAASGVAPTLGSLKLFSGRTTLLNFCGSGICLALDVPATKRAHALLAALDDVVVEAGGIANLSKDSRLPAATVERMFPDYGEFKQRLHDYDPKRRFDSALRRRILV